MKWRLILVHSCAIALLLDMFPTYFGFQWNDRPWTAAALAADPTELRAVVPYDNSSLFIAQDTPKRDLTSFVGGFLSGVVGAALIFGVSGANARFETAADIPSSAFKERKVLNGDIVKIVDGDTYRFRHKPQLLFGLGADFKGPLSEHTLMVRLAAVDTPEIAKFGNKAQPYAQEAKDFASLRLSGRSVQVKLLSRDQYGRVVARVRYKQPISLPFGIPSPSVFVRSADFSEELLREGLGVVYRQGGAQYDSDLDKFNALESQAIQERKGIWSKGKDNADLPSEYKKNLREQKDRQLVK